MSNWNFPGARWWKFDFHTHTPASSDFMKGCPQEAKDKVTPEYWLKSFMEKGIDCVAITDHNSGKSVDKLKEKLAEIRDNMPEWYRPLCLFPGVEISVSGGIHVLAILDPKETTSAIDRLLGDVGYKGPAGESDDVTKKSIDQVIDTISQFGGIAIPAHADKEKGLLQELQGNTLKKVLKNQNIMAIEICESNYKKPQSYLESKVNWTEVLGSDTHNFRSPKFGSFTWVKMGKHSIDGLKLALIDGFSSIRLDPTIDPNRHTDCVIEHLKVTEAQYMGRGASLKCKMSPFLNTVIGGHGSGKSSLLEFMRFVLHRKNELPKNLAATRKNYFSIDTTGLLMRNSKLSLVYRKSDTRYRINWIAQSLKTSIQYFDVTNNCWCDQEGDIASLFPVSIYSQKQIYELAENPQGLLGIIDKVPDVELRDYQQSRQDLVNRYKNIIFNRTQLLQKTQEESNLKGQLGVITRQIEQIEKSGHKDVLQNYRRCHKQLRALQNIEEYWQSQQQVVGKSLGDLNKWELDEELFRDSPQLLETLQKKQQQWKHRVEKIQENVDGLKSDLRQWQQEKIRYMWMKELNAGMEKYKQLREQFEQKGINPESYPGLLQERSVIDGELNNIHSYKQQVAELLEKSNSTLQEVRDNSRQLTQRRQKFIDRTLKNNKIIKMKVIAFGEAWQSMENKIRETLQTGDRFDKDFKEICDVYEKIGWEQVKTRILNIYHGTANAEDIRFQGHLQKLPAESIADFQLWFPQDSLRVTYAENGKDLSSGSPGQKSAALLAFILSYGDEPLLLDQPEDDLDNELVSSLIVGHLKVNKSKRQITVVTHNANIVVNGDSEMVHSLNVAGGQSYINSDSLQSMEIRKRICDTMEGGEKAFEQRYKRIHLEYSHA